MRIVCCGPEGSGTRALRVNIGRLCEPEHQVRHLSMPFGDEWWSEHDVVGERAIIIVRRPDTTAQCAFHQGCTGSIPEAAEEWPRAIAALARIPDAYWLSYEAMVGDARQQLINVMRWLGVPFREERLIEDTYWPWRDENAKYLQAYRPRPPA